MSFYITLLSNGSQQYFSNNRIGNYITKLPNTLQFEPNTYEVGIVGITYVNSIKLFNGENEDNVIEVSGNRFRQAVEISPGHYHDIAQLVFEINAQLRKLEYVSVVLFFNKDDKRIKFTFDHKCKLKISEKLSDVLGFDGKTIFHHDNQDPTQDIKAHAVAKFSPDIRGGKYHLFIYTDIIQPQVVGSTLVPMLRMVNIRGEDGQAVTDVFQTPYYMHLSRNTIENISILICDEFGSEILFDRGQAAVTLHFRKQRK